MQAVDKERLGVLMEAAEGTDMYIPVLTGFCTGMPCGEVLALRWRRGSEEREADHPSIPSQTQPVVWSSRVQKQVVVQNDRIAPVLVEAFGKAPRENDETSKIYSAPTTRNSIWSFR
jgi:hypothetical protein